MSQSSGFVPINFRVAGMILLVIGLLGLILVGVSAWTGWFSLPSAVLISSLAIILISLYLIFVPSREKEDGD